MPEIETKRRRLTALATDAQREEIGMAVQLCRALAGCGEAVDPENRADALAAICSQWRAGILQQLSGKGGGS